MPFIVGVARSGTTLLRLMLDAHPSIAIPPETYFLLPFLRGQPSLEGLDAAGFCNAVTGFHTWSDLGISQEDLTREVADIRPFCPAAATRLIYRLYAARHGKSRWGDKTPSYRRHMLAIERILPEARFIHIIRDGRDVALSLRREWFAPTDDIGGLARHWVEEVEATRKQGGSCKNYLEVRFESLVREPRTVLKSLCSFLGLTFDPAMEKYHSGAAKRLGEVDDQHLPDGRIISRESRLARLRLTSSPPDLSRAGAWRSTMKEEEHGAFVAVAGPLLRDLGYET